MRYPLMRALEARAGAYMTLGGTGAREDRRKSAFCDAVLTRARKSTEKLDIHTSAGLEQATS